MLHLLAPVMQRPSVYKHTWTWVTSRYCRLVASGGVMQLSGMSLKDWSYIMYTMSQWRNIVHASIWAPQKMLTLINGIWNYRLFLQKNTFFFKHDTFKMDDFMFKWVWSVHTTVQLCNTTTLIQNGSLYYNPHWKCWPRYTYLHAETSSTVAVRPAHPQILYEFYKQKERAVLPWAACFDRR